MQESEFTQNSSDPIWRKPGHLYDTLSEAEQAIAQGKIRMPSIIVSIFLPSPQLSILDLISFKLPPFTKSYPVQPYPHLFFRSEVASDDIGLLGKIPIPPKNVVTELSDACNQQWLDGANSVSLPGESLLLPLWAIHFWSEMTFVVEPAIVLWQRGIHWLEREELFPFSDDIDATVRALGNLSWTGTLSMGFERPRFPTSSILPFLSRDWLSDEQIDLMLCSLENSILSAHLGHDIIILNSILSSAIIWAYQRDQTGDEIYNPAEISFLHQFGNTLTGTSRFGSQFHINGNHWVASSVDIMAESLSYGDPTHVNAEIHESDTTVTAALRWFISKHLGPGIDLDFERMASPKQVLTFDSWQCGLFSFNALAHGFLPDQYPLLETSHVSGDLGRLRMLRDILCEVWRLSINSSKPPTLPFKYQFPVRKPVALQVLTKISKVKIPRPKKRKANENPPSVIAPVFKQPEDRPGFSKRKKVKLNKPASNIDHLPSDAEENLTTSGRPRLEKLDILTVEILSKTNEPTPLLRRYRCAGIGCNKIWCPRSAGRVLSHCKRCLKMTEEQRQFASTESAKSSPGALVAAAMVGGDGLMVTNDSQPCGVSVQLKPGRSAPMPRASDFFGPQGRRETSNALDLAILKLFCCARIPPAVVDLQEWKDLFQVTHPSYKPASRTRLMDEHIMSEQERVRQLQVAELRTQTNLTCSFDGGSTRGGDSFYTVHATTSTRKVSLLEGQECTRESHTGEWIAEFVLRVIDTIGRARFAAVVSDNAGNTRVAREILCQDIDTLLNLPDPAHHLNNTVKEIGKLEYFSETVKQLRGTIKFFNNSGVSKATLKDLRVQQNLGAGLESIGKTRFSSHIWAALALRRLLPPIRELCSAGGIKIPKWNAIYVRNTPVTLQFEMKLNQLIAVGQGIAKAIECLEAGATNPADVYLYWLAVTSDIKDALGTCGLPDEVCREIRLIVNARWREFFVEGPTNAHLSAFYLNPTYVKSSIFKRPMNPLTFNIVLPTKVMPKPVPSIPAGINSPKTFIEVGKYLLSIAIAEINHGIIPAFTVWADKPSAFTKEYKKQFTAYAQGSYPFTTPLGEDQDPLNWWQGFQTVKNAEIMAAIAIKLYSTVPHSMADERTMSVVTMINSALRSRQKVETIMAMTQVRGYYRSKVKDRSSARPHPVIKFSNITRVLRSIDEPRDEDLEDDETDDETDIEDTEDDYVSNNRESTNSDTFDIQEEADIDIDSPFLHGILADEAILDEKRDVETVELASTEVGGNFELGEWV